MRSGKEINERDCTVNKKNDIAHKEKEEEWRNKNQGQINVKINEGREEKGDIIGRSYEMDEI